MSQPTIPENNTEQRARPRGAIRTHLGRKRAAWRGQPLGEQTLLAVRRLGEMRRSEQERAFDRLKERFGALFEANPERTAAAFDRTLEAACAALVDAGSFSREVGEQLCAFLRRDLLQKDHPAMTFASGDITSPGTLACQGCAWTIIADRTTLLPACPQCGDTSFSKTT